ncbi:MAG: hypothetical protein JXA69_01675, partial [Phycisphaerae bacterium]|nr:hypothetical protein [Phycisphaerae bacterium]
MARMRNVLIGLAMVALLGSAAGCEWNAMSGFGRTAPQTPSAPEEPAAPEPATEPPAKPSAVEAGPTTEL